MPAIRFSQLPRALALGELDALTAADRFVIRLHLLSDVPEPLRALEHLFERVLRRFHSFFFFRPPPLSDIPQSLALGGVSHA